MGHRVRVLAGLLALAEVVVFVLVAGWIGVGWTLLATLATSALGWVLLARQGTRALVELHNRARERRPSGRALGDAGLIAAGGLLMVLPGFLGDVVGLLCLLPPTRFLVRGLLGRLVTSRLPVELRGPVRVRSARAEGAPYAGGPFGAGSYGAGPSGPASGHSAGRPLVIEGEVVREEPTPDSRS
ncbi:FxsA family protein [Geodermatophilus sp. DF01-2]|uniref:FxsA family protein n=1 Tax=Geodermatophilus sp. DF01-2 TaxID=2559610 RepID=UPI001072FD60|nr:FxsA family protein [Geodermatophilus sp. DF01_2]TFV62433.1 FxsA family protein [Geodermatophilus sp. DF01_2]